MSVVVLTTVLPAGRRGGGEVVTQGIVDALSATGRDVRVVGYRRPDDRRPLSVGEVEAGRRPIETAGAGPRALAWMARALVTRSPYSCAKYDSRGYTRAARRIAGEEIDAVIADHAQVASAARRHATGRVPLVFVAHNAESRVYADLAADASGVARRWVNARESRLIRDAEAELARTASQVWTLTADDADYFRGIAPAADVRTLEVASAIATPAELPPPEYDVALIGSWSWRANCRGLEWFSEQVVPLLPRTIAIEVAGAGADWLRGRHPNVAVRGVVPDAQAFLSRARVVAIPAVAGGGVQVKTLDAIASGVPVVASPKATRGIGSLPSSVDVTSAPAAFASAVDQRVRGDRAAGRAESAAWSDARRAHFAAAVAGGVAALTGDDRESSAVACRSR